MAKIILEAPYTDLYKTGYIRPNRENRQTLYLVKHNETKVSSSTAYARYLMAVHLGRYLEKEEQVDHIDNDKTNDNIENLQILSFQENHKKSLKGYTFVTLICPECATVFDREKRLVGSLYGRTKLTFCSRSCSSKYYGNVKFIPIDELIDTKEKEELIDTKEKEKNK